jgi:hypothetical protein
MSLRLEACSTYSQRNAPESIYLNTVRVDTHLVTLFAALFSYPKHLIVDYRLVQTIQIIIRELF